MSPTRYTSGQPLRIGIVGASTLRGKEIAQIIDERPLPIPIEEMRLLDDPGYSGTLAAAGGEPAIIHGLDEESLRDLQIVFFACDESFAARHWAAAKRVGARVIDLSGALATVRSAFAWIPALDAIYFPPGSPDTTLFYSPGAAAIVSCSVAAAFRRFHAKRMAATFLQPVSEHGAYGIEELEAQTVKLLSFQPFPRDIYDTQVAFNLLDRYGDSSRSSLDDARSVVARDVAAYLGVEIPPSAVQILQAPVFYSTAFSIFLELAEPLSVEEIALLLSAAGLSVSSKEGPPTTNVSVAGSSEVTIGSIRRDANLESGYWLWGAVDNIRLAADNAVRIVERILAKP